MRSTWIFFFSSKDVLHPGVWWSVEHHPSSLLSLWELQPVSHQIAKVILNCYFYFYFYFTYLFFKDYLF